MATFNEEVFDASNSEKITFDSTSGGVGFTSTKIAGVSKSMAVFTLEDGPCRFTVDGSAPTSTVGELINVGDRVIITGYNDISNFKCIRTGTTSGTGYVTYFK